MAALALVRAVTLPVTRGELVAAAPAKLAREGHAAHENAALAKVRQEQGEREFSGISGNTVLAARSLLRRIREVVSAHPEWEIGPSGPSLDMWRDPGRDDPEDEEAVVAQGAAWAGLLDEAAPCVPRSEVRVAEDGVGAGR